MNWRDLLAPYYAVRNWLAARQVRRDKRRVLELLSCQSEPLNDSQIFVMYSGAYDGTWAELNAALAELVTEQLLETVIVDHGYTTKGYEDVPRYKYAITEKGREYLSK